MGGSAGGVPRWRGKRQRFGRNRMGSEANRQKIIETIRERKLVAILRGLTPEECLKVGEALYEGGIRLMEVTLGQDGQESLAESVRALSLLRERMDGRTLVGAGTVLSREQADLAKSAGAGYIITPAVDIEVIRHVREQGLVAIPGALTPTEVVTAYRNGADFVKLFPAGEMGASYLKALRAPLPHVPLLVTGGIHEENLASFLKAGAVGAGVGGKLVDRGLIRAGRLEQITRTAEALVRIAEGRG